MGKLTGRVSLVTGASRGIGMAIARRFAREGAKVVLAARSRDEISKAAEEIRKEGGEALAVPTDVSRVDDVTKVIDRTCATFGGLDVLVNNAGVNHPAPLADLREADWDEIVAVNLDAVFYAIRAALPRMLEKGHGRIINISSIGGKTGFANSAAYCAAKHGVIGLTRSVAVEVAAKGVTVNAICPGWIETPMHYETVPVFARLAGSSYEEFRQNLIASVPQQRLLEADEIASLAVYLASPESAGMTGQSLVVDGGLFTAS